jgi:N-acetylneuraminate synthase
MKKTYIIAEIGINHQGDINIAKKLIDIAAVSGCDAVKFQKRNPDVCVPEDQKTKPRSWGGVNMTYLEYKYKVEFGKKEYDEINRYCKEKGIAWSASPWDLDSVDFLEQYNLPFIKLPSAMMTNDPLLIECVKRFNKVIFSTGMSTQEEINHAVELMRNAKLTFKRNEPIGLLHCNSSYPAPINELNLSAIKTLAEKYPDFEIGYSGHEMLLGTTVASVLLGASIIERHITLDRTMEGSDHACSVTPHGLFKMVSGIRELEKTYGTGVIEVTETEKSVRKKLRG